MTILRFGILSAVFLLPLSVVGETVCSGSTHCFDYDRREPISESIEAELRISSDEYIRLLLSEDFEEPEYFWGADAVGVTDRPERLRKIREHLGFDSGHIETYFRQAFSVPEIYGSEKHSIVIEYGTRTANFDVLHFVAWSLEDGVWRVMCHSYIRRCPPDSTPVQLSPNKSLEQPGDE